MTEKQIIDKLNSINLSLRQKKDLINVIKDITANSGGGGTSTNKDALDVYIDINTLNITINNKSYVTSQGSSGQDLVLSVHDKELYDMLYNFLNNTYNTAYLKSLPNREVYMLSIAIGINITEECIQLLFVNAVDIININIYKQ